MCFQAISAATHQFFTSFVSTCEEVIQCLIEKVQACWQAISDFCGHLYEWVWGAETITVEEGVVTPEASIGGSAVPEATALQELKTLEREIDSYTEQFTSGVRNDFGRFMERHANLEKQYKMISWPVSKLLHEISQRLVAVQTNSYSYHTLPNGCFVYIKLEGRPDDAPTIFTFQRDDQEGPDFQAFPDRNFDYTFDDIGRRKGEGADWPIYDRNGLLGRFNLEDITMAILKPQYYIGRDPKDFPAMYSGIHLAVYFPKVVGVIIAEYADRIEDEEHVLAKVKFAPSDPS